MISVVAQVGRLIEIRVRGQIDVAEFAQFRTEYVVVADMRDTTLKPDVFGPYLRMS